MMSLFVLSHVLSGGGVLPLEGDLPLGGSASTEGPASRWEEICL